MLNTLDGLQALATMGGVFLIAAASPGPNFFVTSQLALSGQRRLAICVSIGVGVGSAFWATLAMVGVTAIMAHAAWLTTGIRIGAAIYLIWIGAKLVLAAVGATDPSRGLSVLPASPFQAFRAGFMTNLANPKACAFWTGIFGTMFPIGAPIWMFPATTVMMGSLSSGWYAGVAVLFSTRTVQRRYDRIRRPLDAVLGLILMSLGARLGWAA